MLSTRNHKTVKKSEIRNVSRVCAYFRKRYFYTYFHMYLRGNFMHLTGNVPVQYDTPIFYRTVLCAGYSFSDIKEEKPITVLARAVIH